VKQLFNGVKKFRKKEYKKNKPLFQKLSNKQQPHTLFIGCSDSRVVPNLITKTLPGELFIVRNIANIIPFYRKSSEYLSTTSAIEYAVNVLNVENIVVCGHSNCGGCRALFYDEYELHSIPNTKKWLELAEPVKEKVNKTEIENDNEFYRKAEQENIMLQIEHLLTYPYIKDKYQKKAMKIYGWYYDIASGIVYNYDKQKGIFERIE